MKEIRELKLDVRIEKSEKDKHEKLYHYVRDRERETRAKVRFYIFLDILWPLMAHKMFVFLI